MTPKPTPSPANRLRELVQRREELKPQGLGAYARLLALQSAIAEEAPALLSDHARLVEEIWRLREALTEIEMYHSRGINPYLDDAISRASAALSPSQKEGG